MMSLLLGGGQEVNESSALLSGSSSSYGLSNSSNNTSPEGDIETAAEEIGNNNNDNLETNTDDNDDVDGNENPLQGPRDGAIASLTRRLRCLFSTITWPIVPLGTIVALALLWVVYAASSLDLRRTCSHPLHWYALASLILVAYIPHHARVRSHLFQYSRERDGPIRPTRVRMYDQFFHTICLLYVYTGVTLIQVCDQDTIGNESIPEDVREDLKSFEIPLNSCAATCPNLYQAMSVYVATLEMFTFALILPLLFLPCIYLWFLRRATVEAEAITHLTDRLREEEAILSNGGVTAEEILDSLERVKLVSISKHPPGGDLTERQFRFLPCSASSTSIGYVSDVKECCICMSEFPVQDEADRGEEQPGLSLPSPADKTTNTTIRNQEIVRTPCGHIFHRECLFGWMGGQWQINPSSNEERNNSNDNMDSDSTGTQDRQRRRARQTCCPLCRKDLRPDKR